MQYYNSFYVDGLENKHNSQLFLRAMLSYCDSFSLIYFQYKDSEKLSKSTRMIKKSLEEYKVNSRSVLEWPGTKTKNEQNHIYRMVIYRPDISIFPVFDKVPTLWDWDYPRFPMDLCFYKDGYVCFASCTHEHWNEIYLKDCCEFPSIADLESLGVSLVPGKKFPSSELFQI